MLEKSFEKFTQQRSYEGEGGVLYVSVGGASSVLLPKCFSWLFKEVSQRCLITPLPRSRGLVCTLFWDFVFFPEEVFFQDSWDSDVGNYALSLFLSGKSSNGKGQQHSSDPDVIFSVNWWTKTRLSACWKCNTQLGQGICIYVSFLGVVFAAIIFS